MAAACRARWRVRPAVEQRSKLGSVVRAVVPRHPGQSAELVDFRVGEATRETVGSRVCAGPTSPKELQRVSPFCESKIAGTNPSRRQQFEELIVGLVRDAVNPASDVNPGDHLLPGFAFWERVELAGGQSMPQVRKGLAR